jgi:hypothetical protein
MNKKLISCLAMVIMTLFGISIAAAQDEQWLQYYSARQARQIIGDMGSQHLEISSGKPTGAELPEFKDEAVLFTRWSSPLVKEGYRLIALDRTQKHGPYDRLYIDSDGDGHLNDETAVSAYHTEQYSSLFGPVRIVFEVEDGPVTYHLNFRFYNYNNNNRLHAYSGCWYEGAITVGESKKHCVLIDQNANGTFDDKSINFHESDRIRIGNKGDRDTRYVGNYIEIDDKLYQPQIARDGAFIKLVLAEEVKFGSIKIPENITEFAVGGENGLLTTRLEQGVGRLPVGKYRIDHWTIKRTDEKGGNWKLEGRWFNDRGLLEVTEDSQISLNIGEPIISSLGTRKTDVGYNFDQSLQGKLGERIDLTRNGSRPKAPKLHIKTRDGSYDRTYSFEYG